MSTADDIFLFGDDTFTTNRRGEVEELEFNHDDREDLMNRIFTRTKSEGRDSITVEFKGDTYRASVFNSEITSLCILRKNQKNLIDFSSLDIPPMFQKSLLEIKKGLVLIVGESGAGKTTTSGSYIGELMKSRGGILLTVEDPIELPLSGRIGKGLGVQMDANKELGGFSGALRTAVRCTTQLIFLGEVRDPDTAENVVRASLNGKMIIATFHADSIVSAFFRLKALTNSLHSSGNLDAMFAESISAVLFIKRQFTSFSHEVQCDYKMLRIDNDSSAKNIIRNGDYDQLGNLIEQFATKARRG